MDNDVLLAIIVGLGSALLLITAYMEWIGLMNLFTPRTGPRYDGCGHFKVVMTSPHSSCWRCRHARLDHALRLPVPHQR